MQDFISADVYTDRMLGSSYKVVKEVYKNLDAIKALADSSTVETLLENYDSLKGVLDVSSDLLKISNNMDAITSASTYATDASSSAESAAESAAAAEKTETKITSLLAQVNEVADGVKSLEYYLTNVNSNLEILREVDANLTSISVLAATLSDDNSVAALDELINNLSVIKKVANKMSTLEELSDKLLAKSTIDKLNSTLTNINAISSVCKDNLTLMRNEVSNMETQISTFSTLSATAVSTLNETAEEAEADLTQIKEDCEKLLEQVKEYVVTAQSAQSECNKILLKVRDLYHQFEDTIGTAVKKAMLQIMQSGDGQVKRILGLGDTMVERIDQLADDATEEAETQISEAAESIVSDTTTKLEELAQETIQEVTDAAEEQIAAVNSAGENQVSSIEAAGDSELAEIEEAGTAKVEEIQSILVDTQYGDILWGYVDYSLAENQEEMAVGITYINAWDEDGYIQINKDTNSFEREPVYIRFYMKSASGSVSYLVKQVKFNLDEVLAASTTAKGIIEIATSDEVRAGDDYELAVTPGALKDALPDLLEDALPVASTDTKGIIEIATEAEVKAGTADDVAVTPSGLVNALPDLMQDILGPTDDGTTNTIVQAIVSTIQADVHLQEDLFSALESLIQNYVEEFIPSIVLLDEVPTAEQDPKIEAFTMYLYPYHIDQ